MIVPLSQGYVAVIDFSDWWKVQDRRWFAHVRATTVYACSSTSDGQTIYMHRIIKPPPEGKITDHADGNGLNNRWSNLRHATYTQNNANAYRPLGSSGFIGVNQSPSGTWRARGRKGGVRHHIGTYDTAEEAAHAFDAWATAEYGEFAVLNFPKEDK